MFVVTIFSEFSGVSNFASDALGKELEKHEVVGPFHAEYLAEGDCDEREQLEIEVTEKEPDVFIIWHTNTSPPEDWVEPIREFFRNRFPKAILIWVVWELGWDTSFDFLDQPQEGSFLVDYDDPKKRLQKWLESQHREGKTEGIVKRYLVEAAKMPLGYETFIATLKAIVG